VASKWSFKLASTDTNRQRFLQRVVLSVWLDDANGALQSRQDRVEESETILQKAGVNGTKRNRVV